MWPIVHLGREGGVRAFLLISSISSWLTGANFTKIMENIDNLKFTNFEHQNLSIVETPNLRVFVDGVLSVSLCSSTVTELHFLNFQNVHDYFENSIKWKRKWSITVGSQRLNNCMVPNFERLKIIFLKLGTFHRVETSMHSHEAVWAGKVWDGMMIFLRRNSALFQKKNNNLTTGTNFVTGTIMYH